MNPGRLLSFVGLTLLASQPFLVAQESTELAKTNKENVTVQLPTFAATSVNTTVSVPDGGTVIIGGIVLKPDHYGNTIQQSKSNAQRLLMTPGSDLRNRICKSQTWQDGMYFNILHDKSPVDITVRREKIEIETVQEYSAENIDELAVYNPDLARKLADFPKTSNGKPVSFTVHVPIKREFDNLKELKWTAPELFVIYHEYVDGRVRVPESSE